MRTVYAIAACLVVLILALVVQSWTESVIPVVVVFVAGIALLILRYELLGRW